jgi:beta-lactamase superfamily II metal-dependent hydrolase
VSAAGIKVRAYNVRFGDCILVSIPVPTGEKHVLFDFGNAPAQVKGKGGTNDVFEPIAKDIRTRTKKVLDLVVMSHEHLDHMEGFYSERAIFDGMQVKRVWLSLMSDPNYYKEFKKARKEQRAKKALFDMVERWKRSGALSLIPRDVQTVIANNNVLDLSNQQRIEYLRKLGSVAYLSRTRKQAAKNHGLGAGVKVEILAPESDASIYYSKLPGKPFSLGARLDRATMAIGRTPRRSSRRSLLRPPHMAADEFDRLKEEISQLDIEAVLAIDKAANNTSLVVRLTANGKVLLFTGDAEEESWAQIEKRKLLAPVDFLKIAHHGSINGIPFSGANSVLERLLKKGKKTIALVSTRRGVYGESKETKIPHHQLMADLKKRCKRVVDTENDAPIGQSIEFMV